MKNEIHAFDADVGQEARWDFIRCIQQLTGGRKYRMKEKHKAFALNPGSSSGRCSFPFIPLFLYLSDPSAGTEQARTTWCVDVHSLHAFPRSLLALIGFEVCIRVILAC